MKSKSLQKVLAIFLALGMLISYLPISATAQTPVSQDEIILESDTQAGTGEYLNLGDPLPADYQLTDGDYDFILDDGEGEDAIGTSAGTYSILALNRFSPGDKFPFLLTEISFLSNYGTTSVLAPGQAIRLVVFQNTNTEGVTDPSDGAELVLEKADTVQVATGWNVYQLDEPLLLKGLGDVLIGVLFEHRPNTGYHPAVFDKDTISGRSWLGLWSGEAPSPITIPAPSPNWGEIGTLGFPGTFNIRAKGIPAGEYRLTGTVTNTSTSAPLVGASVTATPATGNPYSGTTNADGRYNISLDAGTYTVTVAKFGYTPKTESVVIPEGIDEPVIKDFTLNPLPATLLTGTVKDGGITGTEVKHGFSLYAKLSFTAMGITEVAYTDPFTGDYQISLVRDTAYTVKVESLTTDYLPLTENITAAGETQTKNFELLVPVEACSTAGYGVGGVKADFDDKQLPAGWTNYDYQGSGQVWQFDDPGNRGNSTGGTGGFAIVDTLYYGTSGIQHTGLRTPVLDFSAASSVTLEFDSFFLALPKQTARIRYSLDNGTTWTTKLTLPTNMRYHYNIDLPELAGQSQAMVEFNFQATWAYFWQIDNISLSNPTCELKDGGVVAGYVYDANEDEVKLLDAKVETALAFDTTTASVDAAGNGLYWFFQPTNTNPQDVEFTVSKSEYVTAVETKEVDQTVINHIDFELGAGHLVADPTAVEVSMELGQADHTETIVLANDGSLTASWSMTEKTGGFTPMKVSIPAFTGTLPQSDVAASIFRDPNAKSTGKSDLVLNSNAAKFGITDVVIVPAYGVNTQDNTFHKWVNVGVPAAHELVGTPGGAATSLFAGDFMGNNFDTFYTISYDNNKLFAVNTSDASAQEIGTTAPPSGYTFSGLAGTPDQMYGIATACNLGSKLYTVNLETAGIEFVGDVNGPNCLIDITYVPSDGMLYGVDLVRNSFYRIDPATAQTTLVGALGIDPNYAQGMDYDEQNEIMYWAAYDTKPELRVIDMTTGASELIGAFTGMDQVDSFAVAAGGAPIDRIPWLDENIIEGQIEAGVEQAIELTFTLADIDQPGTYKGDLLVKDDTPYADLLIPVTLNVNRPANFGSFKGTIYALKQCDIDPDPAEKATLIFSQNGTEKYRNQADINGYFSYAMLEGTYDIKIELNGYVSQIIEDIELVGGEDYILDDVNLRLDAACLIVDPNALYQEQYTGKIDEQTLIFSNIGAKEAVFELVERNLGGPTPFRPMAEEVNLILDDGSYDDAIGVGGTADFIAVNRFSPPAREFPMTLTEISVYFDSSNVASGQPFKAVIYQNTSGNSNDPAAGSEFLYQQSATIGSVPGWTVVTLDQPVALNGPGDVLIGVIYTHKPGSAYFPASIDTTASQQRSWVGSWVAANAPDTPTLPPDGDWLMVDTAGFASNWMIRAKGNTGSDGTGGDILWLDIDNIADVIMPGDSVEVTFTFDSNGLLWGDYFGNVRVINQPDPTFDIPVQLRVNDWEWQFLPMINNRFLIPAK